MDAGAEQLGTHLAEWQVSANGGLDPAILVLVFLGIVGAVIWSWLSLDPIHAVKIRLLIVGLRALALLTGLMLLLQLTVYQRQVDDASSRLAILVDVSDSMVRGREGGRLGHVKKSLTVADRSFAEKVGRFEPVWYRFADEIAISDGPGQATKPFADSKKTDIKGALEKLFKNQKNTPLDGVVLISDGADTELPAGPDGKLDSAWAETLTVPVNTVFIGAKEKRIDLSIERADVDPFAFSRSETPIAVAVRSVGLSDREIEAFLWKDGQVLQRRTVRIVGGRGHVTFSVFPATLGQHVLTVTVATPPNDEVPENNSAYVTFEVIRDKFRILHIAGHPSWDQRFLRETLTDWPRIDLVSFYILRTEYQSSTLGASGMALIPFPTDDLFESHLNEFDIVVFHNFEPASVGVDRYLKNIADFVKQGGAIVLIGGSGGLGGGKMASGELKDIFPVKLLPSGTASSRSFDENVFRMKLTEAGANHPMMRLKPSFKKNLEYWRSLYRLDGIGRVASVADGALRLAEHPFVLADDGPSPIIAVKEVEKGRSLAIMTDSLWRLRFTGPMTGGPRDAYAEFWRQAVYWLTRSPDLDRLVVEVDPSPVSVDKTAQFQIGLRDEAYRPVPGAEIAAKVTWIREDGSQAEEEFTAVLDDQGQFRKEWQPRIVGPHRVSVTSGDGITATKQFLVKTVEKELSHLEPKESLMRGLAEATGGSFTRDDIELKELVVRGGANRRVLSHSDIPLWDHPFAIIFLIGVLTTEWFVRRNIGLR